MKSGESQVPSDEILNKEEDASSSDEAPMQPQVKEESKKRAPKSVGSSGQAARKKSRKSKKNDYISIDEKSIIPVYFGDHTQESRNPKKKNSVRTTRYTIFTWAPLSLLLQFRRAANIYFLIISVLTTMPFSPKTPASMIGTFGMVLFVTMIKDAFEDYQRYKSDKTANNLPCEIFNHETGQFETRPWKEIKMGNLLRVKKESKFPCDILLLSSSNEDGIVFVDTANLDGETNLKDKSQPIKSMDFDRACQFKGKLFCDKPNHMLDEWDGELISAEMTKNEICDVKNLLLRDCILKNTHWLVGLAVNLGKETKIMMNSRKPKPKVSNMMRTMNKLLYSVFGFQFMIITTLSTLSYFWQDANNADHIYLGLDADVTPFDWFIQLLTYQVTFSHMIPISLYVIIEILKLVQAVWINSDIELYSYENEQYAKCQNSDLIEELGQVEFIFSDKTGTLTKNKMEMKKCCVNSLVFGNPEEHETNYEGICPSGILDLQDQIGKHGEDKDSRATLNFLTALAVCHTVVCDKDPEDENDEMSYQSSSPDELALVNAAKQIGFALESRSTDTIRVRNTIDGELQEYKTLAEFPFDSDRKRMSMIIRDNGTYFLFSKGADTVMIPRLKFGNSEEAQRRAEDTLNKFACEGLRVLCFGVKKLEDSEYEDFRIKYEEIRSSKSKGKDEELYKLYDKMEQDLKYIGISAIEDKLQDNVGDTIALLRSANINVWMLTGDKMETAIEIARSCNLFDIGMTELLFSFSDM